MVAMAMGKWDFYQVSGARPCAKLVAVRREFRVTFTTIPPFTKFFTAASQLFRTSRHPRSGPRGGEEWKNIKDKKRLTAGSDMKNIDSE